MAASLGSVDNERKTFFRTHPDRLDDKSMFCVVQAVQRVDSVITMYGPSGTVETKKSGKLFVLAPEALKNVELDPNDFESCDGPVKEFPNRGTYETYLLAVGRLNPSEAKEVKSE